MTSTANSSPDPTPVREDNHASQVQPVSETIDIGAPNDSPMTVRLIVGQGTHAGAMADIRLGFYMIGRHRECQIRPKSQSVSRRHCLVQHHPDWVRVFDLESKRGTFVNDVRLEPKTWHVLNHGDRLRCGKYWFEVAIYRREADIELDKLGHGSDDGLNPSDSNIGAISDDDLFEDNGYEVDVDSVLEGASVSGDSIAELPDVLLDEVADVDTPELLPTAAPNSKGKSLPARLPKPKIPKPKIRRHSTRGNWFPFDLSGTDSWKAVLAFAVTLAVIGYVGWSVYKIQKGPPIKILRGID